jgi:hypothetical protein
LSHQVHCAITSSPLSRIPFYGFPRRQDFRGDALALKLQLVAMQAPQTNERRDAKDNAMVVIQAVVQAP